MKTIVIDMMGSDLGSKATVEGIKLFLSRHQDIHLIAVGKKEELTDLPTEVEVIDAKDVVAMEAGAMEVMRNKESSMMIAINTFLERQADGLVSAGSTGGFLSASTLKLKLIPGIDRAALMTPFPTVKKGKKVVVLDIGANVENTAHQLVQFAEMGALFSKLIYETKVPKVYLISNGIEEKKGTPEIVEAHKILKESQFEGFMGNVEGREALNGEADVLVSPGFAGNIFLKSSEGIFTIMNKMIKSSFKRNVFSKIGYLLSKKGFDEIKTTFDYKTVGGAMLLGVNGVVVKAHGSSDGFSFSYGIEVAYKMTKANIIQRFKEAFISEKD